MCQSGLNLNKIKSENILLYGSIKTILYFNFTKHQQNYICYKNFIIIIYICIIMQLYISFKIMISYCRVKNKVYKCYIKIQ